MYLCFRCLPKFPGPIKKAAIGHSGAGGLRLTPLWNPSWVLGASRDIHTYLPTYIPTITVHTSFMESHSLSRHIRIIKMWCATWVGPGLRKLRLFAARARICLQAMSQSCYMHNMKWATSNFYSNFFDLMLSSKVTMTCSGVGWSFLQF